MYIRFITLLVQQLQVLNGIFFDFIKVGCSLFIKLLKRIFVKNVI